MDWRFKKKYIPPGAVAIRTVVMLAVVCTVSACGGGSEESAAGGTLTRANVTAVTNVNDNANATAATNVSESGKPHMPGQVTRVTPYEPVVNSSNRASRKLLAKQCIKRGNFSPNTNKVRYHLSTRRSLREAACTTIPLG